ncbi:MAG: hypothetical protein PSV17_12350 [Methylotenera sp.]|uniref:hypothetical protein n=1 Tax=Methylotenera sp. TaxID=2051956 RepID=UPI002487D467|nr:hypothetical protein [Methylotenera sp.]MDI1310202.1 hypothetical protein [Methylotenera sp.]
MSGNALNVCKLAQSILTKENAYATNPELVGRLSLLAEQLTEKNPDAAHSLVGMLQTLIAEHDLALN